jgi:hypothetical protein
MINNNNNRIRRGPYVIRGRGPVRQGQRQRIGMGIGGALFRDYDRDGVANVFDCQPFNKKKQDVIAPPNRRRGGMLDMYSRQEGQRLNNLYQRQLADFERQIAESQLLEQQNLAELRRIESGRETIVERPVPYVYDNKSNSWKRVSNPPIRTPVIEPIKEEIVVTNPDIVMPVVSDTNLIKANMSSASFLTGNVVSGGGRIQQPVKKVVAWTGWSVGNAPALSKLPGQTKTPVFKALKTSSTSSALATTLATKVKSLFRKSR